MECTFPSGNQSKSPIWIIAVKPLESGRNELDLKLWDAAYCEGVQEKLYRLEIVARARGYLLALRKHGDAGQTALVLRSISHDWMRLHFGALAQDLENSDDIGRWVEQQFGPPPSE